MSKDIYRDNNLINLIVKAAGHTYALSLPTYREFMETLVTHNQWELVKDDTELKMLLLELDVVRQTYTSVSDLRYVYKKVLRQYMMLLMHERCYCLMYRWSEDAGLAIMKTIELDGDDKLRDVISIRTITTEDGVHNYEYHDELNHNFFQALCYRMRVGVNSRHSPFGLPSPDLITKFDPQLVNSNGRIAAGY